MKSKNDRVTRLLEWYGTRVSHPRQWWVHERLRQWLGVHPAGDRLVERRGLRLILNPADYMQAGVFWLGQTDRWELYHARRFLRPPWVFLDVGANFGYYSLRLASDGTSACQVWAFEPQEPVFARLNEHVRLNGLNERIRTFRLALGDQSGTVLLNTDPANSGRASVTRGPGQTPITTLDRFAAEQGITRIDLLKLDVEGAEVLVLRGAATVLTHLRPALLVEVNPVALSRQGTSARDLVAGLQDLGYEVWRIRRRALVPLERGKAPGETENVLCLPRERS